MWLDKEEVGKDNEDKVDRLLAEERLVEEDQVDKVLALE